MFPKFSVKKPLTIFVAVLMVIILGFVSFTSMTPDLLPGINLPYAVVVTVSPGSTPEEVEGTISKPLEQKMASLENINSITSTSGDSVSTLMLQFNDSTNMDAMTSEIREKINMVSGSWSEMVQTPMIIKINPNLLPVTISAVSYGEMSNTEITQFVNDTILSELEGITGVASVDLQGNTEEKISVLISQEKIDEVNKKIENAISKQFEEGEDKINDGKEEITDGKDEIDSQTDELDDAKEQLNEGKLTLAEETSKALAQLIDKKIELETTQLELASQLETAQSGIDTLKFLNERCIDINNQYKQVLEEKATLENEIESLEGKTDEVSLARIQELKIQLNVLNASLTGLEKTLEAMGTSLKDLESFIQKNNEQIQAGNEGIETLKSAIEGMEEGSKSLTTAIEELNKQQLSGSVDISSGLSEITSAQIALGSAKTSLESAEKELESAEEELKTQKENALKAAKIDFTMDMVSQILTAQNFSMPAGYITEDGVDYLVRVGDKVDGLDELKNLVLMDMGLDDLEPIKLSDVANVFIDSNADDLYAKVNGREGLILSFSKQSSYATKTVSDNVNAKFKSLEKEYEGLEFSNLTDQGNAIDLIVNNVLSNIISGSILAILILLLFLKDLRPTIIIAFSIPISILFAIVLMYFSGITLNIISLGGLAIGVGMLVDNSVVVIENIHRLRTEGVPTLQAAVSGAREVSGAITASTLTTVCVFLPIVFIEGLTRQLFQDMALTVAYSLIASLIIAITLVPAMASGLLKKQKPKKERFLHLLIEGYGKILALSLKRNWVVIVLAVVLLITSTLACVSRGFIFMPSMSGTQITMSATLDEKATFTDKTKVADEIYQSIKDIEGIETIGVTVASESSTGTMSMMSMGSGSANITVYAIMDNGTSRKDSEVTAEMLEKCEDINAEISAQGSMDMASMMTALGGEGVSVKIYGNDLDNLIEDAEKLAKMLEKVDGIGEVSTGIEDANPEIRIIVDKEKAIKEGLMVAQVYQAVAGNIASEKESSAVSVDDISKDLVIYSEKNNELKVDDVKNMTISYKDMKGEQKEIKLTAVADIVDTKSLSSISRENSRRVLTVSAGIAEGENVTIVTGEAQKVLENYECLTGNALDIGGESESIMEAILQLVNMLLLAVVIIYFIMVAQFQSLRLPFIVMFTIPLAFTGGFLALMITGHEISVISMVGFVMLAGIIVNNGIVLIDYINILRLEGMELTEAIVTAGKTRLRPILMTALTTILGLLFMAFGTGVGSEMMQPMAIVCIGGLSYATLMTLFVVPAMYMYLSPKKMEKRIVE